METVLFIFRAKFKGTVDNKSSYWTIKEIVSLNIVTATLKARFLNHLISEATFRHFLLIYKW